MAGITAWLSWRGWTALDQFGPARSISASRFQLAGPVVIGFVLVIFSLEQLWPAERRPLLARGHLLDLGYLVFYAVLVVPPACARANPGPLVRGGYWPDE